MDTIFDKARAQKLSKLPFALWKKPNEKKIGGILQQTDTIYLIDDFEQKGFVFASFNANKNIILPLDDNNFIEEYFDKVQASDLKAVPTIANDLAKTQFEQIIDKAKQFINNQELEKVVLSRKESVAISNFDAVKAFESLLIAYPSTFVYIFYHPKIGLWLGATPELLLNVAKNRFNTVSLAGTKKVSDKYNIPWSNKEIHEQQLVTDYIKESISIMATDISISAPYDVEAGSLMHIKTDISGTLNDMASLKDVIDTLHPTPAVCGLPKEISKKIILENENYDRSFYTGYVGTLNLSNQTNLYVNLRCTEVFENHADIFAGCGITKDSIPEKEWEESCNKLLTIKRIL